MFAVIKLAGQQHKLENDQVFLSQLTGNEENSEFECREVMIVGEGPDAEVGKPFVEGACVKIKVLENIRGPKIDGFTYRRRKGTKKTWGHRQSLQKLQVTAILKS